MLTPAFKALVHALIIGPLCLALVLLWWSRRSERESALHP